MKLKEEIIYIEGQTINCPAINGMRYVAIKPICNILGVDFSSQLKGLKEHPIFKLSVGLNTTVGQDNSTRDMSSLPLKYFFAWLFGIHPNKVKDDVRDLVIKYQQNIADILYEKFVEEPQFQKLKTDAKIKAMEEIEKHKVNINEAKKKLKEVENLTFNDFKAQNKQTSLFDN